jgi:hypothetical protein
LFGFSFLKDLSEYHGVVVGQHMRNLRGLKEVLLLLAFIAVVQSFVLQELLLGTQLVDFVQLANCFLLVNHLPQLSKFLSDIGHASLFG